MHFIKDRLFYFFIFIIFCALLVRGLFLNEIPIGLNHDEITFVMNAKAVFLTGMDLSGTWNPLSLTPISYGFPMSELPFLIVSPLIGILDSSPFAARIPYVLFSVSLVAVLFFLALRLFGKNTAIIVGLIAAFNPWGIMLGRTAFDSPLAAFFYMLAFLMLLYLKNWKILLAFIPLFLGFYSYIATKIILIPFVVIITLLAWSINKKKFLKYYLLLCVFCIVLSGFFVLSLKSQTTGVRVSELATPFTTKVAGNVNEERQLSITTPLTPIFSNKFVSFGKDFLQKYTGIYSPSYQFFYGDKDMHLSLWFHGYFYYLDLIFLVLGYCALFQKDKKNWLTLTALALIAPLPAALYAKDAVYVTRGVMIFPTFILLIGYGLSYFIDLFKKRKQKIIIAVITTMYVILFLNFINIYLFRFPIYNSEGPDLSSRVMSRYVTLVSANQKVTVYTNEPDALYKDYLFYSNTYNKSTTPLVAKNFRDRNFSLGNVSFKTGCPDGKTILAKLPIVIAVSSSCNSGTISNTDFIQIPQLNDSAPVYKIYFDSLCNKYPFGRFTTIFSIFDFNIEKISEEKFCKNFITSR